MAIGELLRSLPLAPHTFFASSHAQARGRPPLWNSALHTARVKENVCEPVRVGGGSWDHFLQGPSAGGGAGPKFPQAPRRLERMRERNGVCSGCRREPGQRCTPRVRRGRGQSVDLSAGAPLLVSTPPPHAGLICSRSL